MHAGDFFLFTWYNRLHVEELRTVHLHLHGLLVQHSYIISKQTPSIMLINSPHSHSLPQTQHLKTCYIHLLAKVVAFQGPRSKITSNIGQSVWFSNLDGGKHEQHGHESTFGATQRNQSQLIDVRYSSNI